MSEEYVTIDRDELRQLQKDSARLEFMLRERCIMRSMNGTGRPVVYSLSWPTEGEQQGYWFGNERDAIDDAMFRAAIAAEGKQNG